MRIVYVMIYLLLGGLFACKPAPKVVVSKETRGDEYLELVKKGRLSFGGDYFWGDAPEGVEENHMVLVDQVSGRRYYLRLRGTSFVASEIEFPYYGDLVDDDTVQYGLTYFSGVTPKKCGYTISRNRRIPYCVVTYYDSVAIKRILHAKYVEFLQRENEMEFPNAPLRDVISDDGRLVYVQVDDRASDFNGYILDKPTGRVLNVKVYLDDGLLKSIETTPVSGFNYKASVKTVVDPRLAKLMRHVNPEVQLDECYTSVVSGKESQVCIVK